MLASDKARWSSVAYCGLQLICLKGMIMCVLDVRNVTSMLRQKEDSLAHTEYQRCQ